MTIGDGMAAIAVALVFCAMAGCDMVDTVYRRRADPPKTVEQICAAQWWPSDYCKFLTLGKPSSKAEGQSGTPGK